MQTCCVTLTTEGLTLRWEDVSKCLQSSAFLNSEVLALPSCSQRSSYATPCIFVQSRPNPQQGPLISGHRLIRHVMQMFASYECPWARKVFGLAFNTLTDVLSVFATMSGAELLLRYPGPDMELVCEYAQFSLNFGCKPACT